MPPTYRSDLMAFGTLRPVSSDRLRPLVVLVLLGLLLTVGCTQTEPDPRIDEMQLADAQRTREINELSSEIATLAALVSAPATPLPTSTPTPIPSPTRTPVPSPTPGPTLENVLAAIDSALAKNPTPAPGPSVEDIRRAVGEGIAEFRESHPTVTPGPTISEIRGVVGEDISVAIAAIPRVTPGPALSDVRTLIDEGLKGFAEAHPSPTPGPAIAEIVDLVEETVTGQISGLPARWIASQSSVSSPALLADDLVLTIDPGEPLAGRDVAFRLEGLDPWARVSVEFIDPRGQPAEWVTDNELHYSPQNGQPVTALTLFADDSGSLVWNRIASNDVEGIWSVRIDGNGDDFAVTYPVGQLQLAMTEVEAAGLEMRRYQGLISDTYSASLVPTSLAVDSQAHLAWVVDRLYREYGLRSAAIPDIHLVGDQANWEIMARSLGLDSGHLDGWYSPSGSRPGIYMRTDSFRTKIQQVLTHEYVHLVVDSLAGEAEVPAWLNEGLATFVAYSFGLDGQRPHVTRRLTYRSANQVKTASSLAVGLGLKRLESQNNWNDRTDETLVGLQYATAYMVVKFISEEFDTQAPVELISRIGDGSSISGAVREVLGISYEDLQSRFDEWTASWQDADQESVQTYVDQAEPLYDEIMDQIDRRNATLESGLANSQRVSTLRDVVAVLERVEDDLSQIEPPGLLVELHSEMTALITSAVEWMSLARDYAVGGRDSTRIAANGKIDEYSAHRSWAFRQLGDAWTVYLLR